MGSMYRISEQMDDFTANEKKIADFILEFKDIVVGGSVQRIAAEIGVSPAALVRFSKKAGFKGFSDMKVSLARDYHSDLKPAGNFNIDGTESLASLIEKVKLSSLNTVDKTYSLLTHNSFDEAIKRIIGARKIFLGGVGGSGTVADDFYQKLIRVDHNAIFSWNNNLIISSLTHSRPDDVLICFSYSGKTREMIHLANIAKNKGATVIAVTQIGSNPLARIADFVISIPKEEGEVQLGAISSRNSMFIITDLIYFSILNADFEEAINKLLESRKLHKAKNKLK